MSEVQIFNNPQFGQIRTLEVNNQPYFVGNDVALVLGYAKPRNAISQHVDNEDALKQGVPDNQGFIQETTLINESGVYALIFGSKLPKAKAFKRWVTSEVLPSIRKTGSYSHINPADYTRQDLADLILESEQDLQAQDKVIAEQKDKIKELEEKLERTRQEKIDARFERIENVVAKMAEMMMQGIRITPVLPESVETEIKDAKEESQPMLVHEMRTRIKEERGVIIPYPKMFSLLSGLGWIIRNDRYINKPAPVAVAKGYVLQSDSKGVKENKHFYTIRITEKGYRKFVDEVTGKGGLL